ncbi:MAG: hypothetical protein P1V51_18985 [Deltaproteobacteria bacterium]|nr:hypothetical protein [Deltaproteobacteria bacterium]
MPRYDVLNEAIIPAEPAAVYQAILAELRGDTHWWMPDWEAHLLPDSRPIEERGAVIDITVHHLGNPHFKARVMEVRENQQIDLTFPEGDFIGYGEWILQPVPGGTRLKVHFVGTPHRRLSVASLFLDLGRHEYRMMQDGLENLASYLGPRPVNDDEASS